MVSASTENSPSRGGLLAFRGRGLALLSEGNLMLRICPHCSQWLPREALRATCCWCAYEPSLDDAEPIRGT